MDLRDLRYFETIAQWEHVGRAAAQLHRTQPALTSSIRRLEEACGAPLFERAGRGIRLTEAGHVLLRWAKRLRTDVDDARRELSSIGQGLAGQVRIGIVPTAAQTLLPPVAAQLLREAPEVTLTTTVGLVDTLRPKLLAGEMDLLVGTEGPAHPQIVSQVIAQDAIVVAASAEHPLLKGQPALRDLTRYRWALQPAGAPTRDWLDHTFARKGLPRPTVQVEASMLLILPALIAQTDLLSFLSRHHLQHGLTHAGLKEVPVREAVMRRRLVISHRRQGYLSPVAARFVALMRGQRHLL